MIARILCIGDMHKRYKDPSSIKGLMDVQRKIQNDIIEFNKNNGVTHNIILGDWYDRGFHGIGQAFGAIELDRRIAESVDGNVYLCVGNHFYLERDENPEMYIIQPNEFIRTQMDIPLPDKPIFHVVNTLQFGSVQIDFFHFSKVNKAYIAQRRPETTYHIGIYHDEAVVPGWVREQEGFSGSSTQAYINQIYDNIDLAIHGHIHTKIGPCNMQLSSGRKVPMFIPGSMCATANREEFKHKDVSLPIIDIEDDYSVHIRSATFSTHLDELRFYSANKKKTKTLMTENQILSGTSVLKSGANLHSVSTYLESKGYNDEQLKIVNLAITGTMGFLDVVRVLSEASNG